MHLGGFLSWDKVSGEPLTVRDMRITPQARALRVRFPYGGFVWNRPVSLVVERAEIRDTVTIPDVMLMAQFGMVLATILFAILFVRRRS